MESLNDFYDIETSERKIATIENSIHHSLLYNNETAKTYNIHTFLWKLVLSIVIIGIIIVVIMSVLFAIKYLN